MNDIEFAAEQGGDCGHEDLCRYSDCFLIGKGMFFCIWFAIQYGLVGCAKLDRREIEIEGPFSH
jgi:hypothetical protein